MEETQTTLTEEPKKPEPTKDDIGTRYEHLLDYRDSLETCIDILKQRGNLAAVNKFQITLEVLGSTLDAFSGYRDTKTEYTLYKLLNSIPKSKEALKDIGGIPLE